MSIQPSSQEPRVPRVVSLVLYTAALGLAFNDIVPRRCDQGLKTEPNPCSRALGSIRVERDRDGVALSAADNQARPARAVLIVRRLEPLWLLLLTAGLYRAAFQWRDGAFLAIPSRLRQDAT